MWPHRQGPSLQTATDSEGYVGREEVKRREEKRKGKLQQRERNTTFQLQPMTVVDSDKPTAPCMHAATNEHNMLNTCSTTIFLIFGTAKFKPIEVR